MVPATIVAVPDLPVTANGKIDHAALAEFARLLSPAGTTGSPDARTNVESVLADIVAELLKRPQVGVEDNFFLLGGHSMLGAQLIVRIAERYGVEITLLTLFDHPTVAELAAKVERLVIEEIADMTDDELLRANAALSASARGES
jgi:acyl carrier protein